MVASLCFVLRDGFKLTIRRKKEKRRELLKKKEKLAHTRPRMSTSRFFSSRESWGSEEEILERVYPKMIKQGRGGGMEEEEREKKKEGRERVTR